MDKRPPSITVIAWIFIVVGSIGFLSSFLPPVGTPAALSLADLKVHWMVHVARILAVVSGVFMLYGFNWARWLLVIWMVFHLVLSALHSSLLLLMHALIFAVILYFIFRSQASTYFRGTSTEPTPIPK